MRKLRLIGASALVAVMALSAGACGSPGAPSGSGDDGSKQVHSDAKANDSAKCRNTVKKPKAEKVTVWAWYPEFGKLVDHFNETHDDLQVCWTSADQSAKAYSRFNTTIKAKSGAPDVIQLEYAVMPQFASGVEKHLVDLTKFGINKVKSDYTAGAWKDVQLGGRQGVYGVPVDVGPVVMYYP